MQLFVFKAAAMPYPRFEDGVIQTFKDSICLSFFVQPSEATLSFEHFYVHKNEIPENDEEVRQLMQYFSFTKEMTRTFFLTMPHPVDSDELLVKQFGKNYVGYMDSEDCELAAELGKRYTDIYQYTEISKLVKGAYFRRVRNAAPDSAAAHVVQFTTMNIAELEKGLKKSGKLYLPAVKLKRNF